MTENLTNGFTTTLNGSMNNSQTTATLTTACPVAAPFRLLIKAEGGNTDEILYVGAASGTSLSSITRAAEPIADGTQTASAHSSGATVVQVLSVSGLQTLALGTNFIGARVYNSGNQTVSAGVETTVNFDSEEFDTDGFHDTVTNNNRLTVPTGLGGKYLLMGMMSCSSSPGAWYGRLRKNGNDINGGIWQDEAGSGNFSLQHVLLVDLIGGDYVELRGFRTSGTTFNGGAGTQRCELALYKLESGRTGSAIGAKVYRTTTQNPGGSYTAIGMDAEVYDTDGFHDNSTNNTRLTIPTGLGGKYLVTAISPSSPANGFIAIKKNGSNFMVFQSSGGAPSCAVVGDFVAGDYIELMSSSNGNVTIDQYGGFSITKLDTVAATKSFQNVRLYGPDDWNVSIDQGTWAFLSSAWTEGPPPYGGYGWNNTSAAQNDALTWTLNLDSGTWVIKVRGRKSSNIGILTFKLDGTSVGTLDYYNASGAYSVQSLTGINVSSTGSHTLQLIVATKNASSSGYNADLYDISLYRTN